VIYGLDWIWGEGRGNGEFGGGRLLVGLGREVSEVVKTSRLLQEFYYFATRTIISKHTFRVHKHASMPLLREIRPTISM
jgi:hypothetical protein